MEKRKGKHGMDLLTACRVACKKSHNKKVAVYAWKRQDGGYCIDSRCDFSHRDELCVSISADEQWAVKVEWIYPEKGDNSVYQKTAEWLEHKLNTEEWLPPLYRDESPKSKSSFSEQCPANYNDFKALCNKYFYLQPTESEFLTLYAEYVKRWNNAKIEGDSFSEDYAIVFFREKQEEKIKKQKKDLKINKIKSLVLPQGFSKRWRWLIFGK